MRCYEYIILTNKSSLKLYYCVLIVISILILSCSNKSILITSAEELRQEVTTTRASSTILLNTKYDPPADYIPYDSISDLFPMKFIRLNFHYMNDSIGDKNYTGKEAFDFTYNLVDNANKRLLENHKMKLPAGNKTPRLNPKYQYIIVGEKDEPNDRGVYFHTDNDLYYFLNKGRKRNNYKRAVIDKYSTGLDSVLDVFVMPHHPDSVKSKNYNVSNTGIALGHAIKISGLYEKGHPFWEYATLLNHEVGHVMGLSHTWNSNDGCEDTPKNANCFSKTKTAPCNEVISNNLMDYNSSQMAISPCQLGIIHKNISSLGSMERALVRHDWCFYHDGKEITVNSNQIWNGAKDLYANLIVKSGYVLEIKGRVSFPRSAKIIVEKGGTLILNDCLLHNACGDTWGGIECESQKDIVAKGNVRILDVLDVTKVES